VPEAATVLVSIREVFSKQKHVVLSQSAAADCSYLELYTGLLPLVSKARYHSPLKSHVMSVVSIASN